MKHRLSEIVGLAIVFLAVYSGSYLLLRTTHFGREIYAATGDFYTDTVRMKPKSPLLIMASCFYFPLSSIDYIMFEKDY